MFHLPIHTIPIHKNRNNLLYEIKRESRGYNYSILKYQIQITETIFGENIAANGQEEYTVLTDDTHSKIFAYMAPRQTSAFSLDKSRDQHQTIELDFELELKESIEGTMITIFWNEDTN